MIVAIEGGDGTGKQTQSKILAERLGGKLFSFPAYDTISGRAILGHLTEKWSAKSPWTGDKPAIADKEVKELNALLLQSLMLTNRMELAAEIRAAHAFRHVVLDRYSASSFVYGKVDGLDTEFLERANAELSVQPTVQILLDAPVEESWKRRPERRDRYETNREFAEKVRRGYIAWFETKGWYIVNALGTVEEVAERVWAAVQVAEEVQS